MIVTRELNVNLNDWETRYILESLSKEMAHLKAINASSEDEDEVADAGNDFIELSGLYDQMSSNAVEVFGQQILDFSRDEI
ncbi:hypothetical protein [Shewanella livingstonensis]|uniref:Uncharacterized protein n=1 Tax=Shewanella livingstonensis TaxID=150120 RepID=A0A3G8M0G7_9GAMM|nr:hypothetical protein [Shewanella livingstonensis]AZG74478.1 hypothetical protein EGC82_18010 [Shewanella livingstonensis]